MMGVGNLEDWEEFSMKTFIFGLVMGLFFAITSGWICVKNGWVPPELSDKANKEAEKDAFIRGSRHGALMVMNYDRKSEGEEEFKSWDEFEAYADSLKDNNEAFRKRIDELIKKHEQAKKDFPEKPWAKK